MCCPGLIKDSLLGDIAESKSKKRKKEKKDKGKRKITIQQSDEEDQPPQRASQG